jgi:hypothetical protein
VNKLISNQTPEKEYTTKKKIENILFFILLASGLLIFFYYVYILTRFECGKLGYTLCAAIGEDFFHLYQAGYNFVHGYYVYGSGASEHLVTPFFMQNRYFPAMFIFFGWPFLVFPSVITAYYVYLFIAITIHFSGLWLIWLIYKKFKTNKIILGLACLFWLGYFPLNSEWRMGQFNDISAVFFFAAITAIIYKKKILGPFLWIISLAWKPLPLFGLPFFVKTKSKSLLILFFAFFVLLTIIYVGFFQIYQNSAISDFLSKMISSQNDIGFQVHYIDNFGIFSLIGELFYDNSITLYNTFCTVFTIFLFALYGFMFMAANVKDESAKLYYLLFSTSTLLVYHKLVWESVLCFWLPIIITLLLIAKYKREKIFILVCGVILGTPSLFYFQQIYGNEFWRFILIAEKALPQLALYLYLVFKCFKFTESQKHKKLSDSDKTVAPIIV